LRLFPDEIDQKVVLKKLIRFPTPDEPSFLACVQKYLADVAKDDYPTIGVIGMAGVVKDNKIEIVANLKHWGVPCVDGKALREALKFDSFEIINDFTAASYGVTLLKKG